MYAQNLQERIHLRIDPETKHEARQIFAEMGLTTSKAVKLFLNYVIDNRKLPFQLPNAKPKNPLLQQRTDRLLTLEEVKQAINDMQEYNEHS